MVNPDGHNYLFRHFIVRIGGMNIEFLENLRNEKLQTVFNKLNESASEFESIKKNLLDVYFEKISSVVCKKERNLLLDTRRFLRKLKPFLITQKDIAVISSLAESSNEISQLLTPVNKLFNGVIELYTVFQEAEKLSRTKFKHALNNEDFLNALSLSSDSLFENIKIYEKSENFPLNKRLQQLERGLLRYFTRMAAKSTPFSTFCSIIPGSFVSNSNGYKNVYIITDDPIKKQTEVTLNKDLLNLILEFLYRDLDIRRHIPVELNPTISINSETYRFLTNINGKEVFQKLNQNPPLNLLYERLNDGNYALPLGQLIIQILQLEELETNEEEVNAYLSKLIEIGFIRFCIGIPNQDAYWHLILERFLAELDDPKAKTLSGLLKKLQENLISYKNSNVAERKRIIKNTNQNITECFKEISIVGKRKNNLPIYEDATANSTVLIQKESFCDIENILKRFVEITSVAAYPCNEHATMRHFYNNYYKDEQPVPLLRFYEDYYREHYKEHQEKLQKVQSGKKKKVSIQEILLSWNTLKK